MPARKPTRPATPRSPAGRGSGSPRPRKPASDDASESGEEFDAAFYPRSAPIAEPASAYPVAELLPLADAYRRAVLGFEAAERFGWTRRDAVNARRVYILEQPDGTYQLRSSTDDPAPGEYRQIIAAVTVFPRPFRTY